MRTLPLLISLALSTAAAGQTAPPRIGRIIVETVDIYSQDEAGKGSLYRLANRLHVETRASVIRKLLLFREGEELRPERLAETERNLRALHFLKSASVRALPERDGVADVVVTTQDAWSIAPETQAANKGGTTTYGLTISEGNLFGLGKEVNLKWSKGVDRRRVGVDYYDPAINAHYWNGRASYSVNSDGHDRTLTLRRPFYSFAAPWAATFRYSGVKQDDRLYAKGVEVERLQRDAHELLLSYGRAIAPNDVVANRFTAGLHMLRSDFDEARPATAVLPEDRDTRDLFVRFEHAHNDFLKLNFINKDLRYEDFNVGRQVSFTAAFSPSALGAFGNSGLVRASAADGWRMGTSGFVTSGASVETRLAAGPRNTIASASVLVVRRTAAERPQTTLGRLVVNSGWRLDRDVQFFADGGNGLRGYRLYEFSGSRSVIANLEHRLYLGREILQLASPGIVAFLDAGNATDGGLRSLLDLKVDAGFGIRVGLPRTPKNLLRVDFSYPLMRGNTTRRGLVVSFSSGQAF